LIERPATEVAGRDRITGLLRRTTITSAQVRAAIDHGVGRIVDAVKRTLETTPPTRSTSCVGGSAPSRERRSSG
jgi:rod shape-determining protein MreB and related proteins